MSVQNGGMATATPEHLIPLDMCVFADHVDFDRITGFRSSNGISDKEQHSDDITGILAYPKYDDEQVVYMAGGELYKWDGTSSSNITTGGYSDTDSLRGVVWEDMLFGFVYDKTPFKYDGTDIVALGIPAPTVAPTVAAANRPSGTLTDGTYKVYYTWYNSTLGWEGNPSPVASVAVASPNDAILVSDFQTYSMGTFGHEVSADFDKIRIYRSMIGSTSPYYVKTIDVGTANTYIESIGIGTLHPQTYGEPPDGKYACVWDGRVWVAGVDEAEKTIYFSSNLYPSAFNTADDSLTVLGEMPTEITGMKVIAGRMFCFTKTKIYQVAPYGDSYRIIDLGSPRGCIAPDSLVQITDCVVFLSYDGVYYFDRQNTYEMSYPIRDYFQADAQKLSLSNLSSAVACHANRKYTLFARSYSGTYNDTALEFSLPVRRMSEASGTDGKAWSVKSATDALCVGVSVSGAGADEVFIGRNSKYFSQYDTGYSSATSTYKTGQIAVDLLMGFDNRANAVALHWKPTTAAITATLKWYLDGDESRTGSISIDLSQHDGYFKVDMATEAKTIQFELSWANSGLTEVVRIYGLAILEVS